MRKDVEEKDDEEGDSNNNDIGVADVYTFCRSVTSHIADLVSLRNNKDFILTISISKLQTDDS